MKLVLLSTYACTVLAGTLPLLDKVGDLTNGMVGGHSDSGNNPYTYVHVPLKRKQILEKLGLGDVADLLDLQSASGSQKQNLVDKLKKRDQTVQGSVRNEVYQYMAELKIGSNGDTVECALDTGSSDLWVFGPNVKSDKKYDPSKSSTHKDINEPFKIGYMTGNADGHWVKDSVTFGDQTVKQQQFAVVDKVDQSMFSGGIFGIGYVNGESNKKKYPNFPKSLVDNKITSGNFYSLYLDKKDADSGSIVFGGVDRAKVDGQLQKVHVVGDEPKGFKLSTKVKGQGKGFEAMLDCGTTISYIPKEAADYIAKQFGATYDENQQLYFSDSNSSTESVELQFNDVTVKIPAEEALLEASTLVDGAPKKYLLGFATNQGMAPGMNLLGDSFLRSIYTVFDLDNNVVFMGQAKYSSKSDISTDRPT